MARNVEIDGDKITRGENAETRTDDRSQREIDLVKRLAAMGLDAEKELERYRLEQQKKRTKEKRKEELELEKELAKITKDRLLATKTAFKELGEGIAKSATRLLDSSIASVDTAAKLYANYASSINARLQGADKTFESMNRLIVANIGSSQYLNQKTMLTNLNALVEKGIAYNVEQRAFLQSVASDIATTFDAANGTLLQLIRIQQADTTAARLGSEARLTRFLNEMFKDTSYLNSTYETVSSLLMDTSSQLSAKSAVEFEYVVQKWLGSLGSVGLSQNTLQQIATGLNYLGTGNVEGLTGNQSLQNLLVMSANRAGLSYADMLSGGIDAATANKLLGGVASLLQSISSQEGMSQVVKSQYANLFGITLSDMTAIMQLSSKDLAVISENLLSYKDSLAELVYQMDQIPSRMHLSERIQNLTDNVMMSIGGNIANNAGAYTAWVINDLIEKATGGIPIATIAGMGTFVDLNANLNQLVKTGMVGMSAMSQIGTIVGGLRGANNLAALKWGATEYTARGEGLAALAEGIRKTTSQSAYVGNTDSEGMYQTTVTSARDQASKTVTGQKTELTFTEAIENHIDVKLDTMIEILRAKGNTEPLQVILSGSSGSVSTFG